MYILQLWYRLYMRMMIFREDNAWDIYVSIFVHTKSKYMYIIVRYASTQYIIVLYEINSAKRWKRKEKKERLVISLQIIYILEIIIHVALLNIIQSRST